MANVLWVKHNVLRPHWHQVHHHHDKHTTIMATATTTSTNTYATHMNGKPQEGQGMTLDILQHSSIGSAAFHLLALLRTWSVLHNPLLCISEVREGTQRTSKDLRLQFSYNKSSNVHSRAKCNIVKVIHYLRRILWADHVHQVGFCLKSRTLQTSHVPNLQRAITNAHQQIRTTAWTPTKARTKVVSTCAV